MATDDTDAINAYVVAADVPELGQKVYRTTGLLDVEDLDGRGGTIFRDPAADTTAMTVSGTLRNITIDMDFSSNGYDGQGVSIDGGDVVVDEVTILDFGTDDAVSGSGTGIIQSSSLADTNVRLRSLTLRADPDATLAFGWILANDSYSFAHEIAVYNASRYAHESKNDSTFNSLSALIAVDSQVAVAYGQQGGDGADSHVAMGLIGANVDSGFVIGYGNDNLSVGARFDGTTTAIFPDYAIDSEKHGIYTNESARNTFNSVQLSGTFDYSVKLAATTDSVFHIVDHSTSSGIKLDADSDRNFFEVHDPSLTTVAGTFNRSGGWNYNGADANVVHSPGTGERFGTRSGRFHDRTDTSLVTVPSGHDFVKETRYDNLTALMSRGGNGDFTGWTIFGRGVEIARLWYQFGATAADDFMQFGVGGVYRILDLFTDRVRVRAPLQLESYVKADLPSATGLEGAQVYVTDASGGATIGLCNGTTWTKVDGTAL